jgi:transcriptional regulator with XRE-family HTH domain
MLITWKELVRKLNPGLTQQQIGDRYGMPQRTVSGIMSGKCYPTLDNQIKIAQGVGQPLWQLFKWMEEGNLPTI